MGCGNSCNTENLTKNSSKHLFNLNFDGLISHSKNYVDMFNTKLAPNGVAFQGNIKKLKFKSNSFDTVYIMASWQ